MIEWSESNYERISIHVPARGTTRKRLKELMNYKISIHVPARGTTQCGDYIEWSDLDFNPRSREGNDQDKL